MSHDPNHRAFVTLEARALRAIIDAPTATEKLAVACAVEETMVSITGKHELPVSIRKRILTLPDSEFPNNQQIDAARQKLSAPTPLHFIFKQET